MTTYNIQVGSKFEVRNGKPFNVYEVLEVSGEWITYTDTVSQVPRTVDKQTFINFLEKAKATQVQ